MSPGPLRAIPAAAACALLVACGADQPVQPAWVSSHRSTATLTFDTSAPGVCAITVQYPGEAPAAVEYLGGVYVQVRRGPRPASPPTHRLGASGDWHLYLDDARAEILLLTPGATYTYRLETDC